MILTINSNSPDPARIAEHAADELGYPVRVVDVEAVGHDTYTVQVVGVHLFHPGHDHTRSGGTVYSASCECGWKGSGNWSTRASAFGEWRRHVTKAEA